VGHGLVVWATASNAYFSQIVRIQTERGHSVATGGPYRIVRHPSYIGVILVYVATAIALGSWWALIPGGLCAGLIVIRTALEDRTLLTELPGYTQYAQKTRYRLIPGLW
jgi:protein-S-isoprenylcysteine O-methyltransferase Ste14